MSAVIIEHVTVSDLPETWRAKRSTPAAERVTVRIEEETAAAQRWPADFFTRIAGGWNGPALTWAPPVNASVKRASRPLS